MWYHTGFVLQNTKKNSAFLRHRNTKYQIAECNKDLNFSIYRENHSFFYSTAKRKPYNLVEKKKPKNKLECFNFQNSKDYCLISR